MKISPANIGVSKTNLSGDTFVGSGGVNSATAASAFPWKWSYNADNQDLDANEGFSGSGTVGGVTSFFTITANTHSDGGLTFRQDESFVMMGAQAVNIPYADIEFVDMKTDAGASLQSESMSASLASTIKYFTVVLSGYDVGSGSGTNSAGKPATDMGPAASDAGSYMGFYWTDNPSAGDDYSDYSSPTRAESINIEGDMIYLTFKVEGTTDQTGSGDDWGDNTPIAWTWQPWEGLGDGSNKILGPGFTFHGLIGWNDSTTAGNTAISLPIRTS